MFDSYLSEIKNSMSNFFFNLFASIIIISVFMTISVNNAIYAVLFLILAFFSSMCILFLLNVDYLALMFILIYVGAITILFLFVVMMLKIKINEKNTTKFISFINIIICCLIIYNVLLNTDNFNVFLNTDLIIVLSMTSYAKYCLVNESFSVLIVTFIKFACCEITFSSLNAYSEYNSFVKDES